MSESQKLTEAFRLFDAANAQDPNTENFEGRTYPKELLYALRRTLKPGDWVLVKGSRAMAMEDVVWELKKWSDR